MRIRLSLAGWPPLASHMTCLLLGVSLAHLSWREDVPPLRLPSRALVLSLPPALLKAPGGALLKRGMRVHLLHSPGGVPSCRLSRDPLLMLERDPAPVLSAGLDAAVQVVAFAAAANDGALAIKDARYGALLPACSSQPKVTYGAS